MGIGEQESNARRNERWYTEHAIMGRTMRDIASSEGVAVSTVAQAIKVVRESIPQHTREDRIADVLEFYAKVRQEAFDIAAKVPAPVTVGKDGEILIDPTTGEIVRDYSGRLRAYETAMKTVESERKMLGLDAALKVEQTVTDETAANKAAAEAAARLEQE